MSVRTAPALQLEISYKQILKIALPISFALLVPQINFITNNIFLGGLGERELGTAGLTGVYYLIFAAIGFGLNNGLQALISRRAGENRVAEIGKLFSQGVRMAMVIAVIGILLTWFVAPFVLRMSLSDETVVEQSVSFLRIRIWGLPFLYVYQMRNALLVGTNQSKYLVIGTLAETLANVFFDYTLIYGKLGFPQIGFNGAAIASVIAEAMGMFVVFLVIHIKGISKRFSLYKHFGYNKEVSKLIFVQSSPLIFQHAISIMAWVFFYILVERHGFHSGYANRDLAISNTMRNLFGLFGVFTWAFAATSNTMVSNIIGQGKKERVIEVIHKIVRVSSSFAVCIAILLNIFPGVFLLIYGQDPGFVESAIPVVRVVSIAMVLMSFSTIWLNAVTGTGNTTVNLGIEAITIVIYCIYCFIMMEWLKLPLAVGWMSEWIYWISMFTMSFLYIRSGRWKKKVI
ncbi:MATE family efflux transporter [Pseudobacter ginsenosidimutans]|uniref:Multidrug-efflux transporter n=1 Tax=Pseudobacter ginsenosidimutans TaxID=661488 RepID=A0A4Q7N0M8_9BACT|nr:MATE family efflux transporter [Pseudobacter ginsenosidimutans]QEC43747.1 MATE family efflux transporter [Pseudobacter ginsenosidimutans]RZS75161.1 putative MATE family efflux protein [Pseudobacter ginsenosidimutans]